MDSLTHIALGACIGEAFLGKEIGKKAMLWGALAQSIPDIDFLSASWLNPAEALLAHRGFTHSLLFGALITPVFALLADRWHRPHNISMRRFMIFFGVSVFGHLFIDAFNNYGVGWFEPFSHIRISFNAIYVADPFFSIWPGIAVIGLFFFNKHNQKRLRWVRIGLILPLLYLLYSVFNKASIDGQVKQLAARADITYQDFFTTPAPLNNWLWFVVLKTDKGYYTGYRSVFDHDSALRLQYFPQHADWLAPVADHREVQQLIRFSRGFYTAEHWGDTLVFNNLQFGQMTGWQNPRAHFVFHYFLSHPDDNEMVVQRGRFAGWNRQTIVSLWRRIRGR